MDKCLKEGRGRMGKGGREEKEKGMKEREK